MKSARNAAGEARGATSAERKARASALAFGRRRVVLSSALEATGDGKGCEQLATTTARGGLAR